MNTVFKYIRDFYDRELNFIYLLLILAMLGVLIYFNYWHGLEKRYIAGNKARFGQFTGYYLLYLVPFALAFLLQLLFYKDCNYFKNGWFWLILFLAPAIFSFRVNFHFFEGWINRTFAGTDRVLYLYSINWITRVFVVVIPICIIWWWKDRGNQVVYGTMPLDNLRPYILMLAVMIPLIALASTQPDFLKVYPKAKVLYNIPMPSFKDRWRYILFEGSYGFDFVSIEFFFRGFLILALAKICGQHCIIPAACFYCTIHFGKPLGEAVSSFFGGILLAIVSFNTGSIWGGLLVHLGIAWLMEIGGFAGQLFAKSK